MGARPEACGYSFGAHSVFVVVALRFTLTCEDRLLTIRSITQLCCTGFPLSGRFNADKPDYLKIVVATRKGTLPMIVIAEIGFSSYARLMNGTPGFAA